MTQREQILDYIKEFGSITPMEAFSDLGITKLATRISEMRRDGMQFKIETVSTKNRYGKSVTYAKYSFYEVYERRCLNYLQERGALEGHLNPMVTKFFLWNGINLLTTLIFMLI